MSYLYPFFTAFILVFLSELGDKTQLLVLSFSTKAKTLTILLGVALGSLCSHGLAILFGSALGNLDNLLLKQILEFITYFSFIIFGILTLLPERKETDDSEKRGGILKKILGLKLNYALIIAFSIAIGELGDKTFLASLGLGINYPNNKLLLILGAILGMVLSDLLAIILGKLLSKKVPERYIKILSGIVFIIFGIFGFINFIF